MFHLRFTPYDISGYEFSWLDRYSRYIVAKEDVDDNGESLLHYHILIDTDVHKDTVRDMVKARLPIPPTGRGKNNKYYALIENWKDPGYICKYNQIQSSKGFSEKEIMEYVISGKKKYLEKVERTPAENSVTADKSSTSAKPRIGVQQQVISIASAEWYKYKKECEETKSVQTKHLLDLVCKAYREVARGINPYQVRDIAYAILYDDLDYREYILAKIISKVDL